MYYLIHQVRSHSKQIEILFSLSNESQNYNIDLKLDSYFFFGDHTVLPNKWEIICLELDLTNTQFFLLTLHL